MQPFHLAIAVTDLAATRQFYVEALGCRVGRAAERWIDFDFFGHQVSAHLGAPPAEIANPVDGDAVPVPHFGIVMPWDEWEALAERLRQAEVPFVIGPRVRFEGEIGEQGTLFIRDPSGNALEFKTFRHLDQLFAS